MKFKIKHISFLYDGERRVVRTTISGRFLAKGSYFGAERKAPQSMTSLQFVKLPVIAESDPVLTLSTGEKLRVYRGGDPTGMLVEAHSICEVHDSLAAERQKKSNKRRGKKREYSNTDIFSGADIFEDLAGW